MAFLYMMIGLPGVGKSHFISVSDMKAIILSSDMYIEHYAESLGKTYNDVFKDYVAEANELFFEDLKEAARYNQDIIIDRTSLTVKSRKKILDMFPNHTKFAQVIMASTEKHELQLKQRIGKSIPEEVMERMKKSFEYPTYNEGFQYICSFNHE